MTIHDAYKSMKRNQPLGTCQRIGGDELHKPDTSCKNWEECADCGSTGHNTGDNTCSGPVEDWHDRVDRVCPELDGTK